MSDVRTIDAVMQWVHEQWVPRIVAEGNDGVDVTSTAGVSVG